MKNFWRITEILLLLVAFGALSLACYSYHQLRSFPSEEYETRIGEYRARESALRQQTEEAESAEAQRTAALREDLALAGDKGAELNERLVSARELRNEAAEKLSAMEAEIETAPFLQERAAELQREYGDTIRRLEEKIQAGETGVKICYWTLDDGPTGITDQFLDLLDSYAGEHVRVTFFAANEANPAPHEEELLRRETRSGHSVQNHSFSHQYTGNVYSSLESFREQVTLQDQWLYEITGLRPGIFRFPGGSAWGRGMLGGDECLSVLKEMGYEWIDWSCNMYDSGPAENLPDAYGEYLIAMNQVPTVPIAVVLSHDWNFNTLGCLQRAVPALLERGYVFLPLFPQSVTMGENTKILFS